jgi:hypothetical protein
MNHNAINHDENAINHDEHGPAPHDGQPTGRSEHLENVVDDLEDRVEREREFADVPGNAGERTQTPRRGNHCEPPIEATHAAPIARRSARAQRME